MIISHKNKYLFVEIPHTASTTISHELCKYYDGMPILHKHAHYQEFLKAAGAEEKNYFVFAGIRNPLDVVVTLYFKMKTDHNGFFTTPEYWRKNGGHITNKQLKQFKFIREKEVDFLTYFNTFFRTPYDSWGSPSPNQFDFVVRYENLQIDFVRVLSLLGIEKVRDLPTLNKTRGKDHSYEYYYCTPESRNRARIVFGPYLNKWGYSFPCDWKEKKTPWTAELLFNFLRFFKKRFVWNNTWYSRLLQQLR